MDPFYLFLCLLVRGVFSAPAAKLGKLYFAFHLFLVFIISKKGLKIKPELALPDIYILSIQDVAGANLITMPILEASGMPDFYVERYHKTWNRILIAEGCRQNILVHSLVHYVQFEYEPALMSLKE